ncbi:Na(+)/H(+) antiporter subunit C [Arthrobacter echini]|uniref:Na(+)/H(+) antiporter subunit C n=1 Tax=Arthrobacter echini TaxID=1529066 RepID=A0A4S5E9W6_9MICC|nr:NADH-quinone oxidoreductase subunit K [Arthrobacter echini]THJ68506.1 Na(+)/H(+) antiporter subunit C [Arthrobacter echini]
MTVDLTLIVLMAAFLAAGLYLLLERSLTRVLFGLILLGNGVNILILAMSGVGGAAAFYTEGTSGRDYVDSLPQALILTAIVITFAVTSFMLGLIYRSWVLGRKDEVQDDPESLRRETEDDYGHADDADRAADASEFPHPAEVRPLPRARTTPASGSRSASGSTGGQAR